MMDVGRHSDDAIRANIVGLFGKPFRNLLRYSRNTDNGWQTTGVLLNEHLR